MMPRKIIKALWGAIFILFTVNAMAVKPPPNPNQCKNGWTITADPTGPALDFGAFSIDTGSGTLTMDQTGVVTPVGSITTQPSAASTTFRVIVTNTNLACTSVSMAIDWIPGAGSLTGPGTAMLLDARVSDSTGIITNNTLPVTFTPASIPVTLTFHGILNSTFSQAAGIYTLAHTANVTPTNATLLSLGGTATVTSLTPISLAETIPMNFGTVAGGSFAGTIILDVLGNRTITGDGNILAVGPGNAGSFQITGEPNLTYGLLITGPAVLESVSGQQVTATTFTNNSSGTIPAAGIELFQVGATLNLGPLQAAGTYSTVTGAGSPYTVTVNYN